MEKEREREGYGEGDGKGEGEGEGYGEGDGKGEGEGEGESSTQEARDGRACSGAGVCVCACVCESAPRLHWMRRASRLARRATSSSGWAPVSSAKRRLTLTCTRRCPRRGAPDERGVGTDERRGAEGKEGRDRGGGGKELRERARGGVCIIMWYLYLLSYDCRGGEKGMRVPRARVPEQVARDMLWGDQPPQKAREGQCVRACVPCGRGGDAHLRCRMPVEGNATALLRGIPRFELCWTTDGTLSGGVQSIQDPG